MFSRQTPPRNLFSTTMTRAPAARNVADYLASLRGAAPTWGAGGSKSPQWHAANEIVEMGLAAKLTDQLLGLTRIHSLPLSASTNRVIEQYFADADALASQIDAANNLFATIADAQTLMLAEVEPGQGVQHVAGSFATTARLASGQATVEAARTRFARSRIAAKAAEVVLGPHLVTADFLAAHRGSALAACQADVTRRSKAVAAYFVQCLFDGLASGLLGLVAWPGTDVCWYVRNEHWLYLQGHWSRNTYQDWHVCKEVHLMDALTLGGVPGWLDLPPHVQRVAEAIPPLLWSHLGTVVGTMVREREIQWLVDEVSYPAEQVQPQRRLVFDPAIVVGSVLLAGWEASEHRTPGWWMKVDCWLARRGRPAPAGARL
jgi:hypothetical protein